MSKLAIFKTKKFAQWTLSSEVKDGELVNAVIEMQDGLIDARLGGNIYKKRVSLSGKGKRSGARTIVATKFNNKWFFIFGFKKNEISNIDIKELKALQSYAADLLHLDNKEIELLVKSGKLIGVNVNDQ